MTPYTTCAEAAASAAFQAHRAGALDVWEKVLHALEGVLAIGVPARHYQPPRSTGYSQGTGSIGSAESQPGKTAFRTTVAGGTGIS